MTSGKLINACPLGYECPDFQICGKYSLGLPGAYVEEAQEIGLIARAENSDGEDFTYFDTCDGPAIGGLNDKAQALQDLVTKIDDGEPFDLVANTRNNRSLRDYVYHRNAVDALSRAAAERRREEK